MPGLYRLLRPALFALPPERAHRLTLAALKLLDRRPPPTDPPELAVTAFGLQFSNPLGIAAGFDKNAEVPGALRALGFGFAEVGTLTPRPQTGNPPPRLLRLPAERALINRLGFNNAGFDAVRPRLEAAQASGIGPLGVNIGANRDSADPVADYVLGVETFGGLADYLAINISSPNTPGLRALQSREALTRLLDRVTAARDRLPRRTPLLVKIAPDLTPGDRDDIARVALDSGIDGLIVSNTSIARPDGLPDICRQMEGGLSGAPLMAPATALLGAMHDRLGDRLPLIGVGGVMNGMDAWAKIRAGATLVQLYTGLVYEGPGLIRRIRRELLDAMARDGYSRLADAVGADRKSRP